MRGLLSRLGADVSTLSAWTRAFVEGTEAKATRHGYRKGEVLRLVIKHHRRSVCKIG